MKNVYKIGVLLAAMLLSSGSVSRAETGMLHDNGSIQPVSQERAASTHPASRAFLFSVQHAGESSVNVLKQLPKPHTAENTQHFNNRHARAALVLQQYARGHFYLYRGVYRKLTVRKLIYPFHSHW